MLLPCFDTYPLGQDKVCETEDDCGCVCCCCPSQYAHVKKAMTARVKPALTRPRKRVCFCTTSHCFSTFARSTSRGQRGQTLAFGSMSLRHEGHTMPLPLVFEESTITKRSPNTEKQRPIRNHPNGFRFRLWAMMAVVAAITNQKIKINNMVVIFVLRYFPAGIAGSKQ